MNWRLSLALAGLLACRFGGPASDPNGYVPSPDATTKDVAASTTAPFEGDAGSTPPTSRTTDALASDDTTSPLADDDGGAFDAAFADVLEAGGCSSIVAGCDPIHNTGCNALQQCDVNSLLANPPTGLCVFNAAAEGGACTASIFSESCPPKSTCVDGGCRDLCFCNADCPAGQCCSDMSGPPGFTLCRPCP